MGHPAMCRGAAEVGPWCGPMRRPGSEQRLVLVGGGHAHVEMLRRPRADAMASIPLTRFTMLLHLPPIEDSGKPV